MSPKDIHTLVSYARRHLFAEVSYYPGGAYCFPLAIDSISATEGLSATMEVIEGVYYVSSLVEKFEIKEGDEDKFMFAIPEYKPISSINMEEVISFNKLKEERFRERMANTKSNQGGGTN